eukprot:TRINITY_DN1664_c0_g1_i1.p1 TRINITY_DN1664_c0_g1~~TRINITY_DN1664_c0_g1_i1.p1  ORF type:complete len:169 (-),score=48.73 TRINITY_DN1664_c0_g1_i1:238-744(-)
MGCNQTKAADVQNETQNRTVVEPNPNKGTARTIPTNTQGYLDKMEIQTPTDKKMIERDDLKLIIERTELKFIDLSQAPGFSETPPHSDYVQDYRPLLEKSTINVGGAGGLFSLPTPSNNAHPAELLSSPIPQSDQEFILKFSNQLVLAFKTLTVQHVGELVVSLPSIE